MDKRFRDETIYYKDESINISFRPISEIFKNNDTPYLAVGQSKNGKTTLCIDIIHKYAKQCAKIFYVSATDEMVADNAITTIPQVFKRKPTFNQINAIWKDIKRSNTYANKTRQDYLNLISSIYPNDIANVIVQKYNEYMKQVQEKLNRVDSTKLYDYLDVIGIEILSRLIISGVNKYSTDKLKTEELLFVRSILSTNTKTILILDDVSAELNRIKSMNDKVVVELEDGNVTTMAISKAYKALLTDIFTKARRYNCIVCVFVHTWDTIEVKDQIKNFILMDIKSAEDVKRYRTVSTAKVKDIIEIIKSDIYTKYKYHVIVIKDEDICITKADLNLGKELELDELNQNYVDAYNQLRLGIKQEDETEEVVDTSEEPENEVEDNQYDIQSTLDMDISNLI